MLDERDTTAAMLPSTEREVQKYPASPSRFSDLDAEGRTGKRQALESDTIQVPSEGRKRMRHDVHPASIHQQLLVTLKLNSHKLAQFETEPAVQRVVVVDLAQEPDSPSPAPEQQLSSVDAPPLSSGQGRHSDEDTVEIYWTYSKILHESDICLSQLLGCATVDSVFAAIDTVLPRSLRGTAHTLLFQDLGSSTPELRRPVVKDSGAPTLAKLRRQWSARDVSASLKLRVTVEWG